MRGSSRRRVAIAVVATFAAVASSGMGPAAASVDTAAGASTGPVLSPGAVRRTIADLASAGIGVYELGSSKPLVRPTAPVSPLQLTVSQATNAALGVSARSGLRGADLDALAPVTPAEATTVPPTSALVAAYVKVAQTRGARLARRVMGHQNWNDPPAIVFPSLVLNLFVSDLATMAKTSPRTGSSSSPPPSSALGALDRSQPARLTSFSPAPPAEVSRAPAVAGLCSATQDFINNTIRAVFALIPTITPPDTSSLSKSLGSFFGGIVNAAVQLGAAVVNGLVQGAQFLVINGFKQLIQPVLNAIATVAGVVAVIAEVVTTLQPWTLVVTPAPTSTRKAVGSEPGLPGAFGVTAKTALPTGDWPTDIADCARVAGVDLPPLRPQNAPVHWTLSPGGQDLVVPTSPVDTTLATDSTAKLAYATTAEPVENAKTGDPQQGAVIATAQVTRTELDTLIAKLINLLFAQIPAVIAPVVTPILHAVLQPAIDAALAGLNQLHNPNPANAALVVSFHGPPKQKKTKGARRFADGVWQGTAHGSGQYGFTTGRSTITCNITGETFAFRFTLKKSVITGGTLNGQAHDQCNGQFGQTMITGDGDVTLAAMLSGTADLVTGTGSEGVTLTETLSVNGVSGPPTHLQYSRPGTGHFAPTGGSCDRMTGDLTLIQSQEVNNAAGGFANVSAPFDAKRISGPACS